MPYKETSYAAERSAGRRSFYFSLFTFHYILLTMIESASTFSNIIANTLSFTYILVIFVAPIMLAFFFYEAYITYKRNKFINEQEKVVLQVRIPQEIMKSPLAMELFLTSLYQTKGEGNFVKKYINGGVRPWFSLELVSDGGEIKFYIWAWKFWKPLIESQLYAQYPDVEINEVEDYASKFHLDFNTHDLWGCNFILSKPDCYPIKSYVDYQLDKDPKEELKIDPMTPMLEYLGGLRAGEQAWIQIIVRAHKSERVKHGGKRGEKVDWSHDAGEEIKKIKNKDVQKTDTVNLSGLSMSKGDKEKIEAIEKNISKIPFDCGIRVIYLAEKDKFNDINVAGLNGAFRQYNSNNLNGFKADHATDFDYRWQDWSGKKLIKKKNHTLHGYQTRHFFHNPEKGHFYVLNTESIATIYHFPGQVAKTPSLGRINAKKVEAPSNLPI